VLFPQGDNSHGAQARQFTPKLKSQAMLELLTRHRTAGEICRIHRPNDSLLYR